MERHNIRQATVDDAAFIAQNVREPDKDELWATSFATPEHACLNGLRFSDVAMVAEVDGVPLCMWGIAPVCLLTGTAIPWMVGTKDLDAKAKVFLRYCREPLLEMFQGYDRLINYVDARNTKAIRWLRYMGFTVEKESAPYGVLHMPFHKFFMER